MIVNLIVILGLIICAWTDFRERKIYISVVAVDIVMLLVARVFWDSFSPYVAATGLCIGIMFLLIFIVTGGQIGSGDALLFSMVAFAKQGLGLVYCILITFILLFGIAILLMVLKKAGMKSQLPVAPFLLAAYSLVVFGEGIM